MSREKPFAVSAWQNRKRISFLSLAALILVAAAAFQGRKEGDPLFEKNGHFTLSAEILAGTEPHIDFTAYFPEQHYENDKFSCDLSGCDLSKAGEVYILPLFYDGKRTSADLKLMVTPHEQPMPKLDPGDKNQHRLESA